MAAQDKDWAVRSPGRGAQAVEKDSAAPAASGLVADQASGRVVQAGVAPVGVQASGAAARVAAAPVVVDQSAADQGGFD